LSILRGKANFRGISGLLFSYNILYLLKYRKGLSYKAKYDYYNKADGKYYRPFIKN
jgi:hypothetical protein